MAVVPSASSSQGTPRCAKVVCLILFFYGDDSLWAVNLAWQILYFKLAAKFTIKNLEAVTVLVIVLVMPLWNHPPLLAASATLPTAKFTTTKLTRHQITSKRGC